MLDARRRELTAEQAGELVDTFFSIEARYHSEGARLRYTLGYLEMRGSAGGDLRQVTYAKNLMVARKRAKLFSHCLRRQAADAGVDFVEHERRHRIGVSQNGFEREHDARHFIAGGDGLQRLDSFAGVWRPLKKPPDRFREQVIPLPLAGEGWGEGSPHPASGHLLPQGEKRNINNNWTAKDRLFEPKISQVLFCAAAVPNSLAAFLRF